MSGKQAAIETKNGQVNETPDSIPPLQAEGNDQTLCSLMPLLQAEGALPSGQ